MISKESSIDLAWPSASASAAASSSTATLKRLFRRQLQESVSGLLAQLRIGHASHLLITTRLPVRIVGEQSGFPSPSHFYKQFFAAKAMPPGAFRRRYHLAHRPESAGVEVSGPDYLLPLAR